MLRLSSYALWQKITALILFLILLIIITHHVVHLPLQKRLAENQQKLESLTQQQALFTKSAERLQHVVQQNHQQNTYIKTLIAQSYTPQKTLNSLLEFLQKYRISCRGIQPLSITPKNFYEKHYVQIAGRGEFSKILAFLGDMQDSNLAVKCKNFTLRKDAYRDLKFQLIVRTISVKDV